MSGRDAPDRDAPERARGRSPLRVAAGLVGEWLPVVGAAALLVHLTWLGLRPGLVERERLMTDRARIVAETEDLEQRLADLERLERALEDPIYRERLRWQWRLGDEPGVHAAGSGDR